MNKRRGPSPKEELFIEKYMEHGDGVRAAIEAGFSEKSAPSYASQLKRKLRVEIDKYAREHLATESSMMLSVVHKLAREAQSEDVRLKAAKDWLDRAGYKPVNEHRDLTEKQTPEQLLEMLRQVLPEDAFAIIAANFTTADQEREQTKH